MTFFRRNINLRAVWALKRAARAAVEVLNAAAEAERDLAASMKGEPEEVEHLQDADLFQRTADDLKKALW